MTGSEQAYIGELGNARLLGYVLGDIPTSTLNDAVARFERDGRSPGAAEAAAIARDELARRESRS